LQVRAAWTDASEYPEWLLKNVKAGEYEVELTYGARSAGNGYTIEAGDSALAGKTEETGDLRKYETLPVGRIVLAGGDVSVSIKPAGEMESALMNFRELTLKPVEE